jgi:hypothetical protein
MLTIKSNYIKFNNYSFTSYSFIGHLYPLTITWLEFIKKLKQSSGIT